MAGNAALLIDLENFYIGREEDYNRTHSEDLYEFPVDLDSLCKFAHDIAGTRRLIVRRAYANYNDRRPGDGDRRWDYYLQPQPRFLMEQGIEPVQVFRFPGGNNKNAADMKMAMDATALLTGRSHVEMFIIVTGDSDFIPLVLELKRSGAEVAVIGVTGCTKPIFERYCDRFEYFEDLLAARELRTQESSELDEIRSVLQTMLEHRSPIKFAAVKPLLTDNLRIPFDPSRYGSETTGDFLRRNASLLGIVVRRGEHDWEIDVLGSPEPSPEPSVEPSGDPSVESSVDPSAGPSVDGEEAGRVAAPGPTNGDRPVALVGEFARRVEAHNAPLYRELLRQGIPRCYVVSYDDWNMIVDNVFSSVNGNGEERPRVFHQELLNEVTESCTEQGMADAGRKVRDVTFQLFKSGCFHCAEEGAEPQQSDFHWSRPAVLDPLLSDVDDIVRRSWSYLVSLLCRRLEQRGMGAAVHPEPLMELLAGAEPTDEDIGLVQDLVRLSTERSSAST